MRPTDLPVGRPACLTTEDHLRGRLPIPRHPCALSLLQGLRSQQASGTPNPEGNSTPRDPEVSTPIRSALDGYASRYGNIHPFIHSTTPVGLALGPDSPGDDERGPGTLGHPADGILTRLSLLMSAFSLPRGPRHGSPGRFAPRGTLSYPTATKTAAASSVVCLSPATLSARNH